MNGLFQGLFCQMLIGGLPNTISLPLSQCVVPAGINGPVALWITSDSQPLLGNPVDRAVDKQVAGPTIAFIDTEPQLLGQMARTPSGPQPSVPTTLTLEQASSVLSDANPSSTPTPTISVLSDASPSSTPLPTNTPSGY